MPQNKQLPPPPKLGLPHVLEEGVWTTTFSGEGGGYEEAPTIAEQANDAANVGMLKSQDKRKLPASDSRDVPAGEFAALHAQQESGGGRAQAEPGRRRFRTRQGPEELPETMTGRFVLFQSI